MSVADENCTASEVALEGTVKVAVPVVHADSFVIAPVEVLTLLPAVIVTALPALSRLASVPVE